MFGMLAAVTFPKRDERLQRRGGEPGGEVPEQEPDPAERILDVVAEDPEEEHVAEDVEPACVHEHRRERALPPGQVMAEDVPADLDRTARPLDGAWVVAVLGD